MTDVAWSGPVRDRFGASVWRGSVGGLSLPVMITDHRVEGMNIVKVAPGGERGEVVSIGFRSLMWAQDYVRRNLAWLMRLSG